MARRIPARMVLVALVFTLLAAPRGAYATWWEAYKAQFDKKVAEVVAMDKWGNTAFPPRGILAFKYTYNWVRCNKKFDDKGNKVDAVEPLDILGSELDFGLSGTGSGHKFQFFYGITNDIAMVMEVPFQEITPSFDIKFTPLSGLTGTLLGNALRRFYKDMDHIPQFRRPAMYDSDPDVALEALWLSFEALGRPRPNLDVKGAKQEIGDIALAIAWNYWRTECFSFATGIKVGFPTGRIADADNSLIYALGPEIDIGLGSYSLEIGHILDIRPPKPYQWFVLSVETYAAYFFEHRRPAPSTFSEPNEELVGLLDWLTSDEAPSFLYLDAEDITKYFPDLSDLEGDLAYRPGGQLRWVVQLAPTFAWWFPLSFGIQGMYFESSDVKGYDGDGNELPEFQQLVDAFGLVGKAHRYEFWAKATIGLFPLRIPATLAMGFNYYVAGENVLILEDNYDINVQIFCPWELAIPWL